MSTPDLKTTYENCARSYASVIQSVSDRTGGGERVALDGVQFVIICRILGISTDRLDPVLSRYQQHLQKELGKLHCSLESVSNSTVSSGEHRAKSDALTFWITDLMEKSDEVRVTQPPRLAYNERDDPIGTFTGSRDQLSDLVNTSSSVLESLSRLLSRSQKQALSGEIHKWQTKVLAGDDTVALEALQTGLKNSDDSLRLLATEADQRLHVIGETNKENRIHASLIQSLRLRSEDLRLSISREEQKKHLQTVTYLEGSHSVSKFHGNIVFVEKRRNLDSACEGAKAMEIFLRIDSLAERLAKTPKHEAFCTLDLSGIFTDMTDQNYGFIYAWPWNIKSWDEKLTPKTLHQLLVDTPRDSRDVGPSLTHRFEMARRLANCVMIFHRIGWLHKSISSHNVVFFPRNVEDDDLEIEGCMFLVGFEYSRQDGRNFVTEPVTKEGTHDIYRHPDVTAFERRSAVNESETRVFEKKHDLYALGLLLMEIGVWATLESLQQVEESEEQEGVRILTPREFFKELMEGGKESLESVLQFHTGDRYTDATMACLRGDIRGEYFQYFYTRVLESLGYSMA